MSCGSVKTVALHPGQHPPAEPLRAQRARETPHHHPEVDNAHGDEPPRGWSGWWRHLAGELTPPEAWQHRPPAPAELLRYAHKGEWTAPTGARRTAGIWWCRLIALPATVLTGYLAWMTARPSRTAVVVGLWAVLMHVPLVRTAAGWLLPFDPWPTWLP